MRVSDRNTIIETRNLTRKFGDFTANDRISLSIREGEIRAIIGENGAGKSTLMNMLYGILQPTSGQLIYRGREVSLKSPKDAIALGIGMVHQHFKLSPSLTVYENIVLGAETVCTHSVFGRKIPGLLIDSRKEKKEIQELIDRFDFNLNLMDKVADISVGAKQRVEILKMLYRDVDLLILDEPTAVLIPQEVDDLIERLIALKKSGKTIIIITHKLNEVKMCADRISVIRAGRLIGTVPNDSSTTNESLAEMMVGRRVLLRVNKSRKRAGEKVRFAVKDLTAVDSENKKILNKISFEIHENEVVGVAGVEGNGQTELMLALSGLMDVKEGSVKMEGEEICGSWPDELRRKGIGFIPEDRYQQGLCLEEKISNNIIAGYHDLPPYCKKGIMNYKVIRENSKKLVKEYDVRLSADADPTVGCLSGGNAQKVIIAREFSREPRVLLVSQPTRGVDIGAIEFIHNQILAMRDAGAAVMVISSDLSEVVGLSDRIIVMYHGEITGCFRADEVNFSELGLYMSGVKHMSAEEMHPKYTREKEAANERK